MVEGDTMTKKELIEFGKAELRYRESELDRDAAVWFKRFVAAMRRRAEEEAR